MNVLDKAKSHYNAKLAEEPRPISIKQWDTEAFIKPAISLQRLGEIMECANAGKAAEAMALTVIYRLIDEEGQPLFRKADKTELLRHVDPDVLADIVNQINVSDPNAEDIEGN